MTENAEPQGRWIPIDDPVFADSTDPLCRFQIEFVLSSQKPPQHLYHYTTAIGLTGILDTKSVWATHIDYLNDKHELSHAQSVLAEGLRTRAKGGDVKQAERGALQAAAQAVEDNHEDHEAYVFSLTENGDQLSQWRAYGGAAAGYSIGFDMEVLQLRCGFGEKVARDLGPPDFSRSTIDQYHLLRVLYSEEEQIAASRACAEAALADVRRRLESSDPDSLSKKVDYFVSNFVFRTKEVLLSFKNNSFAEEKEWRLVRLLGRTRAAQCARFRTSTLGLVPYVALNIANPKVGAALPIARVILGCCLDSRVARHAARLLLEKYGCTGAECLLSNIPFRTV